MGVQVPDKTREDRIKEGVEILRQLLGTGVIKEEPGYITTKTLIDKWVTEGKRIEERVEFPRYGRRLELVLPRRGDRAAEAVFKMLPLGRR
jgi:hypothetical protein